MHTTSIDVCFQSLWRTPWNPKWHRCQNPKAPRLSIAACEQTKNIKNRTCTNAIYCTLRARKLHKMQNLKCVLAVCALTLAFLKVSMRVYALCIEHIACHLGNFTPLRVATYSICTWSLYCFFRRQCVHCNAPWDSGNSATMSFRNLHVYHGDSYGSHRICIYIAPRRSFRSSEGIPPCCQDCTPRIDEKTPRSAAGMLHPIPKASGQTSLGELSNALFWYGR